MTEKSNLIAGRTLTDIEEIQRLANDSLGAEVSSLFPGKNIQFRVSAAQVRHMLLAVQHYDADEVERLRAELERAQDAFRIIGYSPAYEQERYAFEIGADEPSRGYSHWSWYPIAIARFMRDKIRKLLE